MLTSERFPISKEPRNSNSRAHTTSWEANTSSATQEIPRILWNLKVQYRIHNSPLPNPYPDQQQASPYPPSHFSKINSNIILHLRLGLPSCLLPSFTIKTVYTPPLSPYVLHAVPTTVLILSPKWYLVRSTEQKAPCYVVFSTPLLPHPSWVQISSSEPYSRKPSAYGGGGEATVNLRRFTVASPFETNRAAVSHDTINSPKCF
jgi:hypothetical protein